MTEITIGLMDARRPDDEDNVYQVQVTSSVLPRVGDEVHYWVDYPTHMPDAHRCEDREPIKVSGTVERVFVEYRRMRWGSGPERDVTLAILYLKDYKAVLPPREGKKAK